MAWSSNNNRPGGGFATAVVVVVVVVAGPGQGKVAKAGKIGLGQTKPRLGTTGKPAKLKQTIRTSSLRRQNQGSRVPGL